MSNGFDIICISPPGFASASMVRASRGAMFQGGISLEHGEATNLETIFDAAALTKSKWCVFAAQSDTKFLTRVETHRTRGLSRVILCDVEAKSLAGVVSELRAQGVEVFVQVIDVAGAKAAQVAGADAIVVKGNEAGGRVGEETSFILLQRVRSQVALPVWVRGGVGLNTAAACKVGGAAGVVLDWQLALCTESEIPEDVKARVSRMDGSETAILGQGCDLRYRAFTRAGENGFNELRDVEDRLALDLCTDNNVLAKWRTEVESRTRGETGAARVLLIGQDAAFAASLSKQFGSAAKISEAIRRESQRLTRLAAKQKALRPGGPLAAAPMAPDIQFCKVR